MQLGNNRRKTPLVTCHLKIVAVGGNNPTIDDILRASVQKDYVEFGFRVIMPVDKRKQKLKEFDLMGDSDAVKTSIKIQVLYAIPAAPGSVHIDGLYQPKPGVKPIVVRAWYFAPNPAGHIDLVKNLA